jgi:NAD(P)-dependent dehydrogenase (short-subunit alcohol dehydrogenase family)
VLDLAGRGAIVVGTRRIGAAVAERLAGEGVRLAIAYRGSRAGAAALQRRVAKQVDRSCIVQADLGREDDVARLVETAGRELGDLSFVVNLASDYPRTPYEELDGAAWERGMAAARGAYLLNLQASRAMLANAGPTRGHLVCFGDWAAGETPYAGYLPYLTAKAALHFMVRAFAVELAPHGILVNAVSPGPTARPPEVSEAEWRRIIERAPLRRESAAADIAELVAALLKLETVTGENIRVDSGRHLAGNAGV